MVATDEFKDTIRTHHDIYKDNSNAKNVKKTSKVLPARHGSRLLRHLTVLLGSSTRSWPSELPTTGTP